MLDVLQNFWTNFDDQTFLLGDFLLLKISKNFQNFLSPRQIICFRYKLAGSKLGFIGPSLLINSGKLFFAREIEKY